MFEKVRTESFLHLGQVDLRLFQSSSQSRRSGRILEFWSRSWELAVRVLRMVESVGNANSREDEMLGGRGQASGD